MKIKLDENLSVLLKSDLANLDLDIHTVNEEDLAGSADPHVLAAATAEGRLIFTQDRGFGDIRAYPPGSHPGIVVPRPPNQDPDSISDLVRRFLRSHDLDTFAECIVVGEPTRVRVRRPR